MQPPPPAVQASSNRHCLSTNNVMFKLTQVNRGDYETLAAARPAHALMLLEAWFNSFGVRACVFATASCDAMLVYWP